MLVLVHRYMDEIDEDSNERKIDLNVSQLAICSSK